MESWLARARAGLAGGAPTPGDSSRSRDIRDS
jgi:hypothetical protein